MTVAAITTTRRNYTLYQIKFICNIALKCVNLTATDLIDGFCHADRRS